MNSKVEEHNWYDYPQRIYYWEKDVDYAMFIDENGNSSKISSIFKKIINNENIDENDRYFTITGCVFTKENYRKAKKDIEKLKNRYWKNGIYYDNREEKEKYVCLHSREIRRHDGAFNDTLIDHTAFTNDLTKTLDKIDCTIISVSIDLIEYLRQGNLDNIYEVAFDLLLERYIYVTKNHKKGVIMLEARGKKEDKQLLKHIYDVIYNKGRSNITTNELRSKIVGVFFNPKWNEEYSSTFMGIEIADLFSYPIHQFIKYKKENPAFKILESKIAGFPDYINKGIKIFPNIELFPK